MNVEVLLVLLPCHIDTVCHYYHDLGKKMYYYYSIIIVSYSRVCRGWFGAVFFCFFCPSSVITRDYLLSHLSLLPPAHTTYPWFHLEYIGFGTPTASSWFLVFLLATRRAVCNAHVRALINNPLFAALPLLPPFGKKMHYLLFACRGIWSRLNLRLFPCRQEKSKCSPDICNYLVLEFSELSPMMRMPRWPLCIDS